MPKVICVTSTFPADAQAVWCRLLDVETLRFITRPMMAFVPAGGNAKPTWCEGASYTFKLRMYGFIPFGGRHTIQMERIDPDRLVIQSREQNKIVHTWNHRIELLPQGGKTCYTDIVEIDAGALTLLVALWSHMFYRHRQKRWLTLLKEGAA